MKVVPGFSTKEQLEIFESLLKAYKNIPEIFRGPHFTGGFVERALAYARKGNALKGYDFVDVSCDKHTTGIQVKTFKEESPVTWMRARIENKEDLVKASHESDEGLQALGNAIIDHANNKIQKSFDKKVKLTRIIYARFLVLKSKEIEYTEAPICIRDGPLPFRKEDFTWEWRKIKTAVLAKNSEDTSDSDEEATKKTVIKEIRSLQGSKDGKHWWSWHGMNDNQLHFQGEKLWLAELFENAGLNIKEHQQNYSISDNQADLEELLEFLLKSSEENT